ncbi:MAG: ABC transporter permease [Hyphomicrobiaceae bacterium]
MSVFDSLLIALRALRTNLLRSFLTTLGILIGIASVIIMVAVGAGARSEIDRQISSLGTNMLVIFPGSGRTFGGRAAGAGTDVPLAERDLGALREQVPGVIAISGLLSASASVVRGNINWTTSVSGIHEDYLTVRDWPLASGRELAPEEVRRGAKVALIGETVVKQLFPGEDPIGNQIRIRNVPVTVVGVLSRKGLSSFGRDQDDLVLVPMKLARSQIVGQSEVVPDQVGQIYVKLENGADMTQAEEDIGRVLRERRRIQPGAEDDFNVRNLAEFMTARSAAQQTLSYLLGATSAISLIVGGIGIMNIMLVSVTERTREIGLRLAIGARRRDILGQFLVESVVLCLLGGLLGIGIGIGGAYVVASAAQWPVRIEPQFVALALGTAALIGIVFGFFPARRAAHMNPIDALRSE